MRRRLAARNATVLSSAVIALFLAVGCSKDKNPIQPREPSERLGTPVAAAGVVEAHTTLLWSAPTDELVCAGGFSLDHSEKLIAIRRTTGVVRTLDSASSIPNAVAPDGSAAYYNAIQWGTDGALDTTVARRVALGPGATPRSFTNCVDFCVHVIVPAPDGDQVAIRTLGADSIQIHRLGTGSSRAVGVGVPVAFSPNSSQLLTRRGFFEGPNTASIVTLASGMTEPAGFNVPEPNGGYHFRWDAQGPAALYISADRKNLYRVLAGSSPTLVWTSPDSLHGSRLAWSPSGQLVAVWTSRALEAPTPTRLYELFVVDMMARAVRVAFVKVANAAAPLPSKVARFRATADIFPDARLGGVTFTLGETEGAYVFDGRVYRSPTTSKGA